VEGSFGLQLAPVMLPERAAFHHSTAQGRTAEELDQSGKAAREIGALWLWTRGQLYAVPAAAETSLFSPPPPRGSRLASCVRAEQLQCVPAAVKTFRCRSTIGSAPRATERN
jgi:hypothetical protein